MNRKIEKIIEGISSLKIQGASNVRKNALKALEMEIRESRETNLTKFRRDAIELIKKLSILRCTEPETKTALRIQLLELTKEQYSVSELKKSVLKSIKNQEAQRKEALKKISMIGSKRIPNGATVFTHCHSHTVEEILLKAHEKGKIAKVYCTETRPLFQGRITAKNLSRNGIETIMIVDSAAFSFIHKADLFLTGADAILANGGVVNKIGTAQISCSAKKFSVPHLVASSTHKFDLETIFGAQEKIEERNNDEIWKEKPRKLKILNSAFDITPKEFVSEIITEKGIFSPDTLSTMMYNELETLKRRQEK